MRRRPCLHETVRAALTTAEGRAEGIVYETVVVTRGAVAVFFVLVIELSGVDGVVTVPVSAVVAGVPAVWRVSTMETVECAMTKESQKQSRN